MPNRQNAFESKENALYADYIQGIKLSTGYKKMSHLTRALNLK